MFANLGWIILDKIKRFQVIFPKSILLVLWPQGTAAITLGVSPIERYGFSDSKLYSNFFFSSENKNIFRCQKKVGQILTFFQKVNFFKKILCKNTKDFFEKS